MWGGQHDRRETVRRLNWEIPHGLELGHRHCVHNPGRYVRPMASFIPPPPPQLPPLLQSTDVTRGVCGVPGGPYALLLPRSKDFNDLFLILKARRESTQACTCAAGSACLSLSPLPVQSPGRSTASR